MASPEISKSSPEPGEGHAICRLLLCIIQSFKDTKGKYAISRWPKREINKLQEEGKNILSNCINVIERKWTNYWLRFHHEETKRVYVVIEDVKSSVGTENQLRRVPDAETFPPPFARYVKMLQSLKNLDIMEINAEIPPPPATPSNLSKHTLKLLYDYLRHITEVFDSDEYVSYKCICERWPDIDEKIKEEEEIMLLNTFKRAILRSWGLCWRKHLPGEVNINQDIGILDMIEKVFSSCTSHYLEPLEDKAHAVFKDQHLQSCHRLLNIQRYWVEKFQREITNYEEFVIRPADMGESQKHVLMLLRVLSFCSCLISYGNNNICEITNTRECIREYIPFCQDIKQQTEGTYVENAIIRHWNVKHGVPDNEVQGFLCSIRRPLQKLSSDPSLHTLSDGELEGIQKQLSKLLQNVEDFLLESKRRETLVDDTTKKYPFVGLLQRSLEKAMSEHRCEAHDSYQRSVRQKKGDETNNQEYDSQIFDQSNNTLAITNHIPCVKAFESVIEHIIQNLTKADFPELRQTELLQGMDDSCKQILETKMKALGERVTTMQQRYTLKIWSELLKTALNLDAGIFKYNITYKRAKIKVLQRLHDKLLDCLENHRRMDDVSSIFDGLPESLNKPKELERTREALNRYMAEPQDTKSDDTHLLNMDFRRQLHQSIIRCMEEKSEENLSTIFRQMQRDISSEMSEEMRNAKFIVDRYFAHLQEDERLQMEMHTRETAAMDEIKTLKKEKGVLLNRLSQVAGARLKDSNAAITDLSDPNRPLKIAEQYGEIYDSDWTNALECLYEKGIFSEIDHIKLLLDIMTDAHQHCMKTSETQWDRVAKAFCFNDEADFKMLHLSEAAMQQMKYTRKDTADASVSGVIEEFEKSYKKYRKHLQSLPLKKYVDKCVSICWLMTVQDPPLVLRSDFYKGQQLDPNFLKEYTKRGSIVDYLVWPALLLHDGGPLLSKGVAQPKYRGPTYKRKYVRKLIIK